MSAYRLISWSTTYLLPGRPRDVLHLARIFLVAAGKLQELVAQRRIFFQAKREPMVGPREPCVFIATWALV
jgi:hypothetical protein